MDEHERLGSRARLIAFERGSSTVELVDLIAALQSSPRAEATPARVTIPSDTAAIIEAVEKLATKASRAPSLADLAQVVAAQEPTRSAHDSALAIAEHRDRILELGRTVAGFDSLENDTILAVASLLCDDVAGLVAIDADAEVDPVVRSRWEDAIRFGQEVPAEYAHGQVVWVLARYSEPG